MIKALTLFFVTVISALGQGFGSYQDQPFLVADKKPCSDIPCQIGGLYLRLKASDNPLNVGVSNWVDEIHGWNWFTNNPGTSITNSTNGVLFNNHAASWDGILYNTNGVALNQTQPILVIFQSLGTSGGIDNPIIGNLSIANTFYVGIQNFGVNAGRFVTYQQSFGGYHGWSSPATIQVGRTIDALYVGGSDPVQTYTNGIAALQVSGLSASTFDAMGTAGNNSQFQNPVYVKEVIIWTVGTVLSSLNVSNLHYYSTNTYGPYAP